MAETQIVFKLTGVDNTGNAFGSAANKMEHARSGALSLSHAMEHGVKKAFRHVTEVISVGAALEGLNKIFEGAEKQEEMAKAIGLTGGQYQALTEVAARAGLSQAELNKRMQEFYDGKRGMDQIIEGYASISAAIGNATEHAMAMGTVFEVLSGKTGIGTRFSEQFSLGLAGMISGGRSLLPSSMGGDEARLQFLRMGYGNATPEEAQKLAEELREAMAKVREIERKQTQKREDQTLLKTVNGAGGNMGAALESLGQMYPGKYNVYNIQQAIDDARNRTLTSEEVTAENAKKIAERTKEQGKLADEQQKEREKLAKEEEDAWTKDRQRIQLDRIEQARTQKTADEHAAKRQAQFNEAMRKVVNPGYVSGSGYGWVQAMFGSRGSVSAGVPVSGSGPVNELKNLHTDLSQQLGELRKLVTAFEKIGTI